MYKIGGVGTIFGGRVQTGELKVGMMMTFGPTSLEGKVMSVEMHHESGQMALPGDIIVINTQ